MSIYWVPNTVLSDQYLFIDSSQQSYKAGNIVSFMNHQIGLSPSKAHVLD